MSLRSKRISRPSTRTLLAILLASCAGFAYTLLGPYPLLGLGQPSFEPAIEPLAFTARGTTTASPSNVSILKEIAFRSDGSYRVLQTNFNLENRLQSNLTTIWDVQSGRKTRLFAESRLMNSSTFAVEQFNQPQASCSEGILSLPEAGTVLGYRVVKRVATTENSTIQNLYAPELNCLVMQSEVQEQDANGAVIRSGLYKVNQVVLGEPGPSLFEIPDDYQEVAPSEAVRRQGHALEPSVPDCISGCEAAETLFDKADEEYRSNRWSPE